MGGVILLIAIAVLFVFIMSYTVFLSMNPRGKYITFETFKELYIEIGVDKWSDETAKPYGAGYKFTWLGGITSRWERDTDSQLHAGIVQFYGKHYRLLPIGFIKAIFFIYQVDKKYGLKSD